MSNLNIFVKKFKYPIILVIVFAACGVFLVAKNTFSTSTDTYTRDELQKMLVSAAVSYYYNNYYSDYEQYLLDTDIKYPSVTNNNSCVLDYKNATNCVSNSNYYPLVSTTFFRNLKITPEEVSRSNMYSVDCTGFTYLVYNNVLGYDMSEFYSLSGTANVVRINNEGIPEKRRAVETKDDYYETADLFARVWNSNGNLTRIANCIAKNNGNRDACSFSDVLSDTELKKYDIDGDYSDKGVSIILRI